MEKTIAIKIVVEELSNDKVDQEVVEALTNAKLKKK